MRIPVTPERLAEIRARLLASKTLPWSRPFDDGAIAAGDGESSILGLDADGMAIVDWQQDADLIVHAPDDLRDLLAEVDRLAAHNARIDAAYTDMLKRAADTALELSAEVERLRAPGTDPGTTR